MPGCRSISFYKTVIEADESGKLAVEELAPLHRGSLVIVGAEAFSSTEIIALSRRSPSTGRR
jgi:hypothetical protein